MKEHIIFAVNAVGPLIFMILVGVYLRKINFLPKTFFDQANKLVFRVFIPCSAFNSIYACKGLDSLNGPFLLYNLGALLFVILISLLTTHLMIHDPMSQSTAHQAAFRSNIAILGNALASSLCGPEGVALMATVILIALPLFNVTAVLTLSCHANTSSTKRSAKSVALSIAKNPLILASLLAFLVLIVRSLLPLGEDGTPVFLINRELSFFYGAVSKISSASTPISLIVLGGQLDFGAVSKRIFTLAYGVLWRLVIAPVLAIAGAVALTSMGIVSFGSAEYAVLLATFGSSVAVSSAAMTAQMGGDAEMARQYVIWTNVFLMITLPVEIVIMRMMGLL